MNCALVEDGQWSVGLARTLLQHGAEPTTKDVHLGMSVMHFACVLGQLELVNFLLKSAPDIDLRAKDKRGNTPLHYAAATGNQHILTALLNACSRYQVGKIHISFKVMTFFDYYFRWTILDDKISSLNIILCPKHHGDLNLQ